MKSFDVFDTLIARRYVTSARIFEQISREFDVPDFVSRRTAADDGTRDLAGIYQAAGLTSAMMSREIQLEHEHCFPIQENLDRVQHGDLLLSDMYLPACDILSLVRSAGLDKQVTLYRSNDGKLSGDVWRRISANKPELHIGDNRVSDFAVPTQLGINCELYPNARLSTIESRVLDAGLPNLALLMREIRLRSNPLPQTRLLFGIAGQLNLPWLFFVSELLRRRTTRPKVFLGRDCQLLHRLFQAYFERCYYSPFSRLVAYRQPGDAVRYLRSQAPEDAVFVDISSTGATWQHLSAPLDILVVIYSDLFHYTADKPILPEGFGFLTRNSDCGQTNAVLEILNCADHGVISGIERYDDGLMRAVFGENELTPDVIRIIHEPVRMAVSLAGFYRTQLLSELANLSDGKLMELFSVFVTNLCKYRQVEALTRERQAKEDQYMASIAELR